MPARTWGGAYRWNQAAQRWVQLFDWVSRSAADDMGVLSLALDPSDPNRVYTMNGKYTQSWAGNGAFMASNDQGATWTRVALSLKVGGNEDGRGAGERIAVDPNLGTTIFMGSTANGLWKSVNRGAAWTQVTSFTPTNVNFVALDKSSGSTGSATPVIFAAAAVNGSSLYRSADGGATWALVPGAPAGQMALRYAFAPGLLYLSFSDGVAPTIPPTARSGSSIPPLWPGPISPLAGC
jgi:hypothetical protein